MTSANVFDDRPCALGEGPLWHPERRQLFWFDIIGKALMTRDANGPRAWQFDRHVSAAGWIDRDRLLIATETDLIRFDLTSGAQTRLCELESDNPATRSNDGRADPWGGFWIGTMGKGAEPRAGAIYRYHRGELRRVFDQVSIPNAICFAPDATFMHFADTARGIVWRQALNRETGWPEGARAVFLEGAFNPDGAVIDRAGTFWCAEWGSARVRGYAPDGAVVADVALPASQTSCPALGGSDLYVTTARQGLSAAERAREPGAGQVFVVKGVAPGQDEHRVIL